jgi:hypothetical protein
MYHEISVNQSSVRQSPLGHRQDGKLGRGMLRRHFPKPTAAVEIQLLRANTGWRRALVHLVHSLNYSNEEAGT